MKCVNVWLLRHGKTLGPAALNGHFDAKVSQETQLKIKQQIEQRDVVFSHVITSPLSRCFELAQLISEGKTFEVNPDWMEMDFGKFDGIAFDNMPEESWPILENFWTAPGKYPLPGAETLEHFYQRVAFSWESILPKLDKDTLIVTHGGVIRMLLAKLLDLPWDNPALFTKLTIANQSLTHLEIIMDEKSYVTVKTIGVTL